MIFLGIDIGTSRVKALAYSVAGRRSVAMAERVTPVMATPAGEAHDASDIFGAVLECVVEIARRLSDPRDVVAIGVVSLGEEVVLADHEGLPVLPTPAWYESPGQMYAEQYPVRTNPTYSLFLLRWLAERYPAACEIASSFTDIGSYIACRLSGRGADLVMDHSHASRTGFFDVAHRAFDMPAVEWAGDWRTKTPMLVSSGAVIGQLDPRVGERLGFGPSVAVVAGAHDHFSAAFAAGVRVPGDAMISAGTSEAILLLATDMREQQGNDIDYGAFVDGRTTYVHSNSRAGKLFAHWADLLGLAEPHRDWFMPPRQLIDHGRRRQPRALIDEKLSQVTFDGLSYAAEPAEIMRSLSEGLAVRARATLAGLEARAGQPAGTLTVAAPARGGQAWLELRSAVFDRPLRVVSTPEPSALGAALLAQRGVTGQADTPTDTFTIESPADPAVRDFYGRLVESYTCP